MNRLDRNEHLTRARLFSPTTAFGAAFALPILLPGADTALITSAHWAEHTSPVCGCTPAKAGGRPAARHCKFVCTLQEATDEPEFTWYLSA